ncbi:MAG: ABC transporter permease [Pseudolysinimonas sp.]
MSEVAVAQKPPKKPSKKQRVQGRDSRGTRLWTGFVGGLVEAWAEVRVHRTQVLLSLIGVVVAVTALTWVVAAGAIATQSSTESLERQGGRPATLNVGAYDPMTGASPTRAAMDLAFAEVMKRYDVTYTSRTNYGSLSFQFPDGVVGAQVVGVDQPFAAMHRVGMAQGSWFSASDTQRLAPAIVISEEIWNRLGSPALSSHPTIQIVLPTGDVTAVIIGITPAQSPDGSYLLAYLLNDNYDKFVTQDPNFPSLPNYEAWVPPAASDALIPLVQRDIAAQLGQSWEVNVSRQDYLAYQTDDPLFLLKVIVFGIAVLVMVLGALGLLNVALVSVKHRIREIGIRRAFGATAGRVFFSVLMESVVATFVAGVVGVILAILLIKNPIFEGFIAQGVQDVPGFPVEAALIGIGAATLVGALAGLIPALVAVRVKVIDAIRY